MDAIGGAIFRFRFEAENRVADLLDGTRYVVQRFPSLQANLGDFARSHLFDKQLGPNKSHRTHLICDVQFAVRGRIFPFFVQFERPKLLIV